MPAKTKTCPCGSERIPTMRCMGIDFCSACVDGTDDRPSLLDVRDSDEAIVRRAERRGQPVTLADHAASQQARPIAPLLDAVAEAQSHRETRVNEWDEPPTAPEGFITLPSINGGTTTMRAPRTATLRQPSPKSLAFLRTLLGEREGVTEAEAVREVLNRAREDGVLDQSLVSSCIDTLRKITRPRTDLPTPGQPIREYVVGEVHVIDGDYYRIHRSQNTGGFYACRFDGQRFEYVKGGIRLCTEGNRCTAEQAARFGHMHHQCVFCARRLDTPESTAVGYGPVCADKHGLPWG